VRWFEGELQMPVRIAVGGLLFALLLGTGLATRASGAGPLIIRDSVDDTFTTGYCGFPMQVHTTGDVVVRVFFDESGNFARALITAPETRLQFTNLDTGASVWTPSVNMVQETANADGTGTQTLRGLLWHLVVPGQGLVTADVGRIDFQFTFDEDGNIVTEDVVFAAGQWPGQNVFFDSLCPVLQ
jgi:hypothetical protein